MLQPIGKVGKVPRTISTLVRSIARMDVAVLLQFTPAQEALLALGTNEWPIVGMDKSVDFQAALSFVRFSAFLAHEWPIGRVMVEMTLQVRLLHEALITIFERTDKGTQARVFLVMVDQVDFLDKLFVANITGKFGILVGFPVRVQSARSQQHFATVWTGATLLGSGFDTYNVRLFLVHLQHGLVLELFLAFVALFGLGVGLGRVGVPPTVTTKCGKLGDLLVAHKAAIQGLTVVFLDVVRVEFRACGQQQVATMAHEYQDHTAGLQIRFADHSVLEQ
jgi:hypothetical protein